MKRFNFPLDRVRRWRLEQLDVEELKLQHLRDELEGLAASKRLIQDEVAETQREVLGQAYMRSAELETLDSYRIYNRGRIRDLENREWERGTRVVEQRAKVIEARRQFELLEQLRKKSFGAWKAAVDKDQEDLAAELFLGRYRSRGR
jgi:5-methylcytosine-specific restriction endonuclease McrBC GTP-binding regulatory subunit McrB